MNAQKFVYYGFHSRIFQWHTVFRRLDSVKRGLVKRRLVKRGLVKRGLHFFKDFVF